MLSLKDLVARVENEDGEGKEIIRGLTLDVPAGEVHAIMGPNGAGKSTLSYVLAGRDGYVPTSGSAETLRRKLVRYGPRRASGQRSFPFFPISP